VLRLAYAAADVMLVPSLQDNLPNTAIEAQCCGTPVVAFAIGGLSDIVAHEQTGYLARAFDTDELAHGILWVLQDTERHAALRAASRERALALFEPHRIAGLYRDVYSGVLAGDARPG
jgi:glycosyltransferase involved in cell wall biosynthesis